MIIIRHNRLEVRRLLLTDHFTWVKSSKMKKPQSNKEIRQWYKDELTKIPGLNEQWISENVSLEKRAERAYEFRRAKRLEARAMMANPAEVEFLRQLDIANYGTPDGPIYEFLIKRLEGEGVTGNAVYEAIIKGSYRSNAGIDKLLGF